MEITSVDSSGNNVERIPGLKEPRNKPPHRRVEELRDSTRSTPLKSLLATTGRNGIRVPRRVTFLVKHDLDEDSRTPKEGEEKKEETNEATGELIGKQLGNLPGSGVNPLEDCDQLAKHDSGEETLSLPLLNLVCNSSVISLVGRNQRKLQRESASVKSGSGRISPCMRGRGRPAGASGGGDGWYRQLPHQQQHPSQHHVHHQPLHHPIHQQRQLPGLCGIGFTGGGDLGLATTACSSSLLCLQRTLPSPGGSFPSRGTFAGAFLSGSSGSGTYGRDGACDSEAGFSDLRSLQPLTEDSILHNLITRHKRDQIYTYVGTALISINPYRRLALYSPDIIHAYHKSSVFQLPPHIYSLADSLHRGVWESHTDQILVVTGESGAGKTEAVKLVVQYVAAVTPEAPTNVRQRLLQSHSVLEAFGNARTQKNDNSSRFAKYMDVEFNYKGDPIGGIVSCYLLEKFRVTTQPIGERNFHIFFQVLSGTDTQTLKILRLQRNIEHYTLLNASLRHHSSSESKDDKAEYVITKRAFEALGFSSEEQLGVLRIVAAVLKFGNLSFTSVNNIDGSEGCAVENEYELCDICELLQCDLSYLTNALKTRVIEASHSREVTVELSAVEAAKRRDALCRALYLRLFSWIVTRINDALKVKSKGRRRLLGLMDIYGFEIMERNGFEQLVINSCNEKLHQTITAITLKELQEEYIKEGLEWSHIEYVTNYSTVEILELSKVGILSIIEEVTAIQVERDSIAVEDEILLQFVINCGAHPNFEVKGARHQHCDNNLPADAFRIRHYAGAVTYSIRGFAEKNTDNLAMDLRRAMFQCQHPILKAIFPEGNPRKSSLKRPCSAVNQAQMSIGSLLRTIHGKAPRFIYCVKPNELKQPRIVETALLSHQIKYLGLLEQSRLSLEGWAFNCLHEVFLIRYKLISRHTWPSWRGSFLEGCAIILADLPIPPAQYTFGRTKVFIKSQKTVNELEHYRRGRLEDLAVLIQKIWRGFRLKTKFRRMILAQIKIANFWKNWRAREEIRDSKYKIKAEWAARVIQYSYINYQRYRLLNQLLQDPPNESPISSDWPTSSLVVMELSTTLRKIHHKWRCFRYRLRFDQTSRNRMREKVTASLLFKDRKASYSRSISHPFLGDYVRLRHSSQWKKQATQSNDQYVVFADMVNKIARSSGKFVPMLLALSTNALSVVDQRTLQVKYRIPASDIFRISLSPFMDDICVLHVKPPTPTTDLSGSQNLSPGCLFGSDEVKRKGDFVLQTGHVIEVVTKLFLVVQNAIGKPPDIAICTEFEANFGHNVVLFTFKTSGFTEVTPNQIRIVRRQNRMEVIL